MRTLVVFLISLCLLNASPGSCSAEIINFEDKGLAVNSFYNGGPVTNTNGWTSGGAFFRNSYDSAFGGFWNGWSYSNVTNATTQGFGNQYAAFAGSGYGGNGNYAVAYQSGTPYINLPTGALLHSTRVTNTTYAALSMSNGDNFSKKFGGVTGNDPDFFLLTIRGYDGLSASGNATGSAEIYLADYRSSNSSLDFVVADWRLVDLTSLGNARSLGFSLSSSDNGNFGMNTPAYFALDELRLTAVPEPSGLATLGFLWMAGLAIRRKRCIAAAKRHILTLRAKAKTPGAHSTATEDF
jgi:hypothetical protein